MKRQAIGVGLLCLLTWLLFIQFFGTPWPWKLWVAKKESMLYLETKYEEPFTVGMPHFWIMDGNFHAEASPTARPDIVFNVGTEQGAEGIQDNYEAARKAYEVQHVAQQIVTQAFPSEAVDISMSSHYGLDGINEVNDVMWITLDTAEHHLAHISAKLYPLAPQLQALPIDRFTILVRNQKLELRHDTQLAHEVDFHALWQEIE